MTARTQRKLIRRATAAAAAVVAAPLLLVAVASATPTTITTTYGADFEVFESPSEISGPPAPGSVNLVNDRHPATGGTDDGADDWVTASGRPGVVEATRRTTPPATPTASICDQTAGAGLLYCDTVKNDASIFNGGAKESDPANWSIISGSVTPKTDITNTYALGRTDETRHEDGGDGPWIINGMERLPKAGDVHLDFEYNAVVNTTTSRPTRQEGDLLVAYDLGGSRSPGSIHVRIFQAKTAADGATCTGSSCYGYDYDNPDYDNAVSTKLPWESGVFAGINDDVVTSGAWQSYNENYNLVDSLPAYAFAEAKIDLKQAVGQGSICANFLTVKSRASESVTSQLKDTTGPQNFGFCGGITFYKQDDLGGSLSGAWFQLWKDLATDVKYSDSTTLAGTTPLAAGASQLTLTDASFLPSAGAFKLTLDPGHATQEEAATATSRIGNVVSLETVTTKAHVANAPVQWGGTCSPSGSPATCTISGLPYGSYYLEETSAPTGYNPAGNTPFTLSAASPNGGGPLTIVNSRAPITLTINKKDDSTPTATIAMCATPSSSNCAQFALFEDAVTGGAFAPLRLPTSAPTTATLAAPLVATGASATSATLSAVTGFNAGSFAEIVSGSTKERVKITALNTSTNVATIVRGVDGTTAAGFPTGAVVTMLVGTDPLLKFCAVASTPVPGRCTIATVYPGNYWVDEVQVPTGYAKAAGLPATVVVAVGDQDRTLMDGANSYFTDPRLFKVITLVCVKSSNQLYSSSVAYDGETPAQASTPHDATLPDGVSEAELCGLGGAVHDNVLKGAHSSAVDIPRAPLTP